MNNSMKPNGIIHSDNEVLPGELILNYMVVWAAILGVITFVVLQIRTLEIGWTVRDSIQCGLLLSVIVLAIYRQKISTKLKTVLLVIIMLITGFVGFYTLGMLAGSVFYFPLAVVTVALCYSGRTTFLFTLLLILALGFIAFGFSSDQIKITNEANLLLTSHSHWYSYLTDLVLLCALSSLIILAYRKSMWSMISKIKNHRDELIKTNKDLQEALEEVKVLQGILPLCSFCKKIRNDEGYWEQVDVYLNKHSEADISHGICPNCRKEHYPGL